MAVFPYPISYNRACILLGAGFCYTIFAGCRAQQAHPHGDRNLDTATAQREKGNSMKRDFLKALDIGNGAHLSDDLIERIMSEQGKHEGELQSTITALTTERDGLKAQLSNANTAIQSYKDMDIDGIKQSAADWENKYNTETNALKEQLENVQYGHAVETAVGGMKFTSESAKKAFMADLTAKKLPIQEGKLLGLEDFTKGYKEADPGAFAPTEPTPTFTTGSGQKTQAGTASESSLRAAFGLKP